MVEPPRETGDHALRYLSALTPGSSLSAFDLPSPRFVRALPTVVPVIATAAEETDQVLEGEDGSIWHLEFQLGGGPGDAARLLGYHLALLGYDARRQVTTVVFWGRGVKRARPLEVDHQVVFAAHQVFLGDMDGAAWLAEVSAQLARGEPLNLDQLLAVAMLPLMRHEGSLLEVLRRIAPLVETLEPEMRRPVMGAMAALAYSRLSREERGRTKEVLMGMPLAEEFFRDMQREGRQEGGLAAKREAVLEAFAARFGVTPPPVERAVGAATDTGKLSEWLRAIIRAQDQAAAERAVLGAH